eukprot:CAMPEP_0197701768 /NCGR_PEP_ID=MMETSP1338-20131121/123692_1 /TAXON_ID=43686 ORGANISM="Pelagodinium beii, Strain RCC1491" /NCGR_SAMPLE_ID=MMETSP1338 /ASSEMBLY_ACC=CAM_ASM_000754 /LENGTH=89 /DNA_ID=CAMNT_0043285513 /DNA_START=53 /DNA_END=320 /DNA_ORIENTATION=-
MTSAGALPVAVFDLSKEGVVGALPSAPISLSGERKELPPYLAPGLRQILSQRLRSTIAARQIGQVSSLDIQASAHVPESNADKEAGANL